MVVADTWAEQKVLMCAYQSCGDQSRPSILLQGVALAMGPASPDPHGPWGVHVDDERDGRAQELREQLEVAAARMAGTAHPPRLSDEESGFERKTTNQWSAWASPQDDRRGASPPRDRNSQVPLRNTPAEPIAAPTPSPAVAAAPMPAPSPKPELQYFAAQHDARTIMPFNQDQWSGTPPPAAERARRETPRGWEAPSPGASQSQPRFHRAYTPAPTEDSLSKIVGRTMPLGFNLAAPEREVLNQLGKEDRLAARDIGRIAEVADGVAWMEALMSKLADHGLDIVEPGDDIDGEPTYILRR